MLRISREDVRSDVVTDFPAATRFIKLPIVNYLKLLPATGTSTVWDEINRPQIALINAVNNPKYRFVCAALSRRLGKTYISNIIGQLVTLVPGSNVLIISPNYNLSSISFELQRKFIKHFDLEVARDNLKDRIIELENGSTIRMGSLSTVDSCVGRSYDLIIFDEAALGSGGEAAFNVALRPTLDKVGAKAIFISTPRGKNNWFSKFHARGFSAEFPEWCSIVADYTENHRMTESDVSEARRSMSRSEFQQEYMASFTEFEGQIYQLAEDCVISDFTWERGDEVFAGIDPGYKDPTAFVVIVYRPSEDCYYVIDDYLESQSVTSKHAARFTEFISKYGIETIFIDSAAAQFASDLAYTYDIASIRGKKDVLPGIAFVQTLVEQNKIKVLDSCKYVLEMFDSYQWDTRETLQTEKPLHNNASHIADAVRYALYTYTI